jgi:hypothetical protein
MAGTGPGAVQSCSGILTFDRSLTFALIDREVADVDKLMPLLRPPLPRWHTPVAMHSSLPDDSVLLFRRVSAAVAPEGPRPPGGNHHCLEVVVTGVALGNRPTVLSIIVNLAAVHGAPCDEVLKRLLGKRTGVPSAVIAGLRFLGCVDAEQPHELRAESHGIAIYNLKTRL